MTRDQKINEFIILLAIWQSTQMASLHFERMMNLARELRVRFK